MEAYFTSKIYARICVANAREVGEIRHALTALRSLYRTGVVPFQRPANTIQRPANTIGSDDDDEEESDGEESEDDDDDDDDPHDLLNPHLCHYDQTHVLRFISDEMEPQVTRWREIVKRSGGLTLKEMVMASMLRDPDLLPQADGPGGEQAISLILGRDRPRFDISRRKRDLLASIESTRTQFGERLTDLIEAVRSAPVVDIDDDEAAKSRRTLDDLEHSTQYIGRRMQDLFSDQHALSP